MSASEPGALLALILTCAASPPARVAAARQRAAAMQTSVRAEFVDGYVAGDAAAEAIYDARANRLWVNRPLSASEIAAYATHRLAWRRLVESGEPFGLVLEDDFRIADPDRFADAVARATDLCAGRDIVKLFDFRKRTPGPIVACAEIGPLTLAKWRYPTAGAVAYLITRAGAAKLLARGGVFRPIDEDFKYFWELDLDIWSVLDGPVEEDSPALGGSLIDAERKAAKSRGLFDRLRGNLIKLTWRMNCYLRSR